MKKILFILLLTIPFVGFGQSETILTRKSFDLLSNKGTETSPIYYYDSEPYTGIIISNSEDKLFVLEGNYKDGIQHGPCKWYWHSSDGRLHMEGNYKDGKSDGLFKLYYPDGKLDQEWNYKDGVYHGFWRWYYPENRQLMSESIFKDGRFVSTTSWNEQGNVIDKSK
jgi:antitoxin component YwqK of YwqJK toxin-antitoxin module